MVLGRTSTSPRRAPTENISKNGRTGEKTAQIEGHRKNKIHKVAKPPIHGSKEGLARRQTHYRPIRIKRIHKMPEIQDVNNEPSSTTTSKDLLDSVFGFKRRILAHSSNPSKKNILRLQIQKPKLAFPSITFRPKCGTKNIHKGYSTHSKSDGSQRHMVSTLSRRPVNNLSYKRRMPTSHRNGNYDSEIVWLDCKPKEIPPTSRTGVRMVGSKVRPSTTHSTSNSRKNTSIQRTTKVINNFKVLLKARNNESAGPSKLDRTVRPSNKINPIKNKSDPKNPEERQTGYTSETQQRNEVKSSKMAINHNSSILARTSSSVTSHTNRRFIRRLGIQHESIILQRRIRPISRVFNKHPRTANNLVCTSNGRRKKYYNTNSLRQLHSNCSGKTLYVNNLPPSNDFGAYLEKSNRNEMDDIDLAHTRKIQRHCRSTKQEYNSINRMVNSTQRLSKNNIENEPETTSGSIRHLPQSSVENLHISMSRPGSSWSRCNENQLEQVESPICVSPDQNDFEGFIEINRNPLRECNTDNPRYTNQTVVHGPATSKSMVNITEHTSTTNSGRQIGNSSKSYQTSRLEIITAAYNKQFPNCPEAVNLMAAPLRKTSVNDYQQKWKTFLKFLESNEIQLENVTIGNVLQFFTYLFYEKHRRPGTVAHYRTALTIPLKIHYQIDLRIPAVADLLRSMNLQRPVVPVKAPAWSLNKVLEFLDSTENTRGKVMQFRKTAFLLLLATGWRISELHACVRDPEFCRFTEDSSLLIRPHPSFLAKNEHPQIRWVHKEIKVLKLKDGTVSNICPIAALKKYLQNTSKTKTGSLFLKPNNHKEKFTVQGLSTQICSVILQADPSARAKIHDVRKYAASCALAETMLVGDLVSAMNWTSPGTFMKFYLTQTEPLTRPVALPTQRS